MADEAAFHEWLCNALSRVKLEDEAYVGYVESILKEDTYQPDEKKDAVLEFLASSSVRIPPPPEIDVAPARGEMATEI